MLIWAFFKPFLKPFWFFNHLISAKIKRILGNKMKYVLTEFQLIENFSHQAI